MDKKLLDWFAQLLRARRQEYLREFCSAEESLKVIAEERESELEEHAQEEQSARVFARLEVRSLHAVREIDAALQRMVDRIYGKCESCHRGISISRLRSLPATRVCRRCAERREVQPLMGGSSPETRATGPGASDLALLSDAELVETIRQRAKADSRIDLE